jgi:hypothetical protein
MAEAKQPWTGMDRMHDVAQWLHLIALGTLGLAWLWAVAIFVHLTGHPQRMGIMDGAWQVAALFAHDVGADPTCMFWRAGCGGCARQAARPGAVTCGDGEKQLALRQRLHGRRAPGQGLAAAVKAGSPSLAAWQVGMGGVMALIQFPMFVPVWGARMPASPPGSWLATQWAMVGGFITSCPVNGWPVRIGIKHAM